jgi:hypothetical protein
MTRLGRKPQGVDLLLAVHASETAKRRLTLFLQTIAGEVSVGAACAELDLSESRFHEQRKAWLDNSAQFLEPRPAGRPAKPDPVVPWEEAEALREQLRDAETRETASAAQAALFRQLHMTAPENQTSTPGKKTTSPVQGTRK